MSSSLLTSLRVACTFGTACSRCGSRPVMMTTFASLNCRASSSPIPLLPPVIRIVRPANRIFPHPHTYFRRAEISDKHVRIDRRYPMDPYLPDRECPAEIDARVEALVTDLIGCVADK